MTFDRFLKTLDADSHRPSLLGLAAAAGLLAAWAAWLVMARVSVYEVSDRARLEADRAAHVVQAPVTGRVLRAGLTVGRTVRVGDVLVEIDAESERLQYKEEQARIGAVGPQLDALRAEVSAEATAIAASRDAARAAQAELRAELEEAETAERLADIELERVGRLREAGLVPEVDFLRARSSAGQRRAAAEQRRVAVTRAERDQHLREQDRQVRLERLSNEIAALEGTRATSSATAARWQHEITRRQILAPISGTIGEASVLRPGAVVNERDVLAAIVPADTVRAIAEFAPGRALGRLHPGLRGRLRLDGFPWAQYGSLPVLVSAVAGEVRNGTVRVELAVEPLRSSSIAVQHGLPGTIEIEIERVAPVTLVLRAAGRMFMRPAATGGPSSGSPDTTNAGGVR